MLSMPTNLVTSPLRYVVEVMASPSSHRKTLRSVEVDDQMLKASSSSRCQASRCVDVATKPIVSRRGDVSVFPAYFDRHTKEEGILRHKNKCVISADKINWSCMVIPCANKTSGFEHDFA